MMSSWIRAAVDVLGGDKRLLTACKQDFEHAPLRWLDACAADARESPGDDLRVQRRVFPFAVSVSSEESVGHVGRVLHLVSGGTPTSRPWLTPPPEAVRVDLGDWESGPFDLAVQDGALRLTAPYGPHFAVRVGYLWCSTPHVVAHPQHIPGASKTGDVASRSWLARLALLSLRESWADFQSLGLGSTKADLPDLFSETWVGHPAIDRAMALRRAHARSHAMLLAERSWGRFVGEQLRNARDTHRFSDRVHAERADLIAQTLRALDAESDGELDTLLWRFLQFFAGVESLGGVQFPAVTLKENDRVVDVPSTFGRGEFRLVVSTDDVSVELSAPDGFTAGSAMTRVDLVSKMELIAAQ